MPVMGMSGIAFIRMGMNDSRAVDHVYMRKRMHAPVIASEHGQQQTGYQRRFQAVFHPFSYRSAKIGIKNEKRT